MVLLTAIEAWYSCEIYPQVSLLTGCCASTYQPMSTISVNCMLKGKVKSVYGMWLKVAFPISNPTPGTENKNNENINGKIKHSFHVAFQSSKI